MVVAKKRSAQMVQRTCEVAGLRETVVKFTGEFQKYRRKSAAAQAEREVGQPAGFLRRSLFAGLGASLATVAIPQFVFNAFRFSVREKAMLPAPELLYPPVDLSYFDTPIGWRA